MLRQKHPERLFPTNPGPVRRLCNAIWSDPRNQSNPPNPVEPLNLDASPSGSRYRTESVGSSYHTSTSYPSGSAKNT
jgi:hypothetical protein